MVKGKSENPEGVDLESEEMITVDVYQNPDRKNVVVEVSSVLRLSGLFATLTSEAGSLKF
jgi:hypothetical protein